MGITLDSFPADSRNIKLRLSHNLVAEGRGPRKKAQPTSHTITLDSLYQRLKSACVSSSRVLLLKPQCMFQDWHSQGIFASQTPLPFSAMQPITGYAIKLRNKKFFKHIGNIFQLYRTRIHLQRPKKFTSLRVCLVVLKRTFLV